jgi:hypothetical protein
METWAVNYLLRSMFKTCEQYLYSTKYGCLNEVPTLHFPSNKKTSFLILVRSNFAVIKLVDVVNKALQFICPVSLCCPEPPSSGAVKLLQDSFSVACEGTDNKCQVF